MVVEVALGVGPEAGDGHAEQQQRAHVGAAGSLGEVPDAPRLEQRAPAGGAQVGVALGAAEVEAGGGKAAVVSLDGEHVPDGGGAGELGVTGAAGQAVLLVGEQHAAQRVARMQAERAEETEHFHRLDDPGAVVMRARRDVPRVEVPADEDDLVRKLTAPDLADHVLGRRGRQGAGRNLERDARVRVRGEGRGEALGGEDAQGDGGDAGIIGHVRGVARVGKIVMRERERPDEHGHGPEPGGGGGSLGALVGRGRVGVLRPGKGWVHGPVVEDDAAGDLGGAELGDLGDRVDLDHLGGEPARGRGTGVAEGGGGERHGAIGGEQRHGLRRAALPVRHHHLLGVDAVQAESGELQLGPVDGARQRRRAGEASRVARGEFPEPGVGRAVGEGFRVEAVHGGGGRVAGLGGGRQGEEKQQTAGGREAHGDSVSRAPSRGKSGFRAPAGSRLRPGRRGRPRASGRPAARRGRRGRAGACTGC